MAETTNGDGSAFNFDRKLDRINDTLASMAVMMIDFMRNIQSYVELTKQQHEMVMDEIHGLIELQKEQRIDIMALFESQRQVRSVLEKRSD